MKRIKIGDVVTCARAVRSGTWATGKPGVYSEAKPGTPLRVVDALASRHGKRLMLEGMGHEGWLCTWALAADCTPLAVPAQGPTPRGTPAVPGRPVWWDRSTWDPDFGGECA